MCILMIIGRMILNKYSQKTWVVFVQGSFSRGGLCPGGFSPDGFCPGGFRPGWFLSVYHKLEGSLTSSTMGLPMVSF